MNKLDVTKKEIRDVMKEARKKLDDCDFYGPFGHNIVGLILKSVADKIGTKYANDLVREYDTEDIGIYPVEEL